MTPASRDQWTPTAGWSTLLTAVWLLGITLVTWLDNRGQPWLSWAFALYATPPGVLLGASLLAWRGPGRLKRVGWGLFVLVSAILTLHVGRELLARWAAGS